eukprot:TRINITY_DN5875_c0_g1_i1.p1 TRINITY_DN5875_c0_g1~~TRINITY_DN5875_c0_g1_i1.p1  ORF type:complete len:422 (+),score=23.69 TRINITY_DN5875_c0_g1_i1:331-1596(+)
MVIVGNHNYSSTATVLFQRFSVIVSDIVFYCGVSRLLKVSSSISRRNVRCLVASLALFEAGLMLVDHIHFQYNGMLMGLYLLSMSFICEGSNLVGAILFAVVLNFKHIFMYIAPVYFVYLLRVEVWGATSPKEKRTIHRLFFNFVRLGGVVICVFLVSFGPFLYHNQLKDVLLRLFPFDERGLTHAYWAPNFWALYSFLDKILLIVSTLAGHQPSSVGNMTGGLVGEVKHSILPSITPSITMLITIIALLPVLVSLWRFPNPKLFILANVYSVLCFFSFGWHVHEKAILMATIPFCFASVGSAEEYKLFKILSSSAHFSLFPLLFDYPETPVKITLVVAYLIWVWVVERMLFKDKKSSTLEILHLVGYLIVSLFYSVIHPVLLKDRLPFLPLLMFSVYCALGVEFVLIKIALFITSSNKSL